MENWPHMTRVVYLCESWQMVYSWRKWKRGNPALSKIRNMVIEGVWKQTTWHRMTLANQLLERYATHEMLLPTSSSAAYVFTLTHLNHNPIVSAAETWKTFLTDLIFIFQLVFIFMWHCPPPFFFLLIILGCSIFCNHLRTHWSKAAHYK